MVAGNEPERTASAHAGQDDRNMDGAADFTDALSTRSVREADLATLAASLRSLFAGDGASPDDSVRELPAFLAQLPFGLCVTDLAGCVLFANDEALGLLGFSCAAGLAGRLLGNLFDDAEREDIARLGFSVLGEGGRCDVEVEAPSSRGCRGWLMLAGAPVRDRAGKIAGMAVLVRDITERRGAEALRRGHAALLEKIARGHSLDGVLDGLARLAETQLSGISVSILFYEERTGTLHHGAAPSMPVSYTSLIDGVKAGENVGSCGTAAWTRKSVIVSDTETDPRWAAYKELLRPHGWRSCWSTPIIDASGTLFGTFALYSREAREPTALEMEITAMATDLAAIAIARARTEERIRHLANHDALTGLPNRRHFLERFAVALAAARIESRHLAIAYFDLDDFKQINDTLGHGAGDAVLCEMAGRLKASIREEDLAVRLGGDEFAVVMACDPAGEAGLLERLSGLRETLASPIRHAGRTLHCAGSMGIAVFPRDGATPDALIARADASMYDIKKRTRNRARRAASLRPV